jgi:hypothetical protein
VKTVRSQVPGLQDALQAAAAELRDHPPLDRAIIRAHMIAESDC